MNKKFIFLVLLILIAIIVAYYLFVYQKPSVHPLLIGAALVPLNSTPIKISFTVINSTNNYNTNFGQTYWTSINASTGNATIDAILNPDLKQEESTGIPSSGGLFVINLPAGIYSVEIYYANQTLSNANCSAGTLVFLQGAPLPEGTRTLMANEACA